MIELYTSNFARSGKLPNSISIARSSPYWWSDRRPRYLALVPEAVWLSLSGTEYDAHFNRLLEQLDARTVIADLAKLVAPHQQAVLLCFESPGIRCHRRRVSQWIESETGLVVPELGFDDVPPYELLPTKPQRIVPTPKLPLFDEQSDIHSSPLNADENEHHEASRGEKRHK